jgi:phage/plasmid primase-like uncharacterized protein
VNGEIRSVQSIQENGRKRFAAGGAKQDTFHVVGGQGLEALEKAPVSFSEDDGTILLA